MVCGDGDGWGRTGVSQGDRIEASFGEGMTAGDAAKGQPGASEDAEADKRNVSVFGACGEVEALGGAEGVQDWRND